MRKRQVEPSHNEDERIVPAIFLSLAQPGLYLAIFSGYRYNAVHMGG
jgi:hypothetical protein